MLNDNQHLPLVSVVTPSFNAAEFIEQTIQSVMSQDYPNLEHIVVDGGSTDGTIDILNRYRRLRWISEKDNGQSEALNKGFGMARGSILCWLNGDDTFCAGDIVRAAVSFFQDHPQTDMVYGDYNVIDQNGQIIHTRQNEEFDLTKHLLANQVGGAAVFMRRAIVERVGGIDPTLHYAMDYDLWLRLAKKGAIRRLPRLVSNFRLCQGTKSAEHPECFWPEIVHALEQFFDTENGSVPTNISEVQSRVYAENYWRAGLAFYAASKPEQGMRYCKDAAKRFGVFEWNAPMAFETLAGWALVFYAGDPETYVLRIISDLRASSAISRRLARRVLGYFYGALAFRRYARGDNGGIRRALFYCFVNDPLRLRDRGLLSIGIASVVGKQLTQRAKRLNQQSVKPEGT